MYITVGHDKQILLNAIIFQCSYDCVASSPCSSSNRHTSSLDAACSNPATASVCFYAKFTVCPGTNLSFHLTVTDQIRGNSLLYNRSICNEYGAIKRALFITLLLLCPSVSE